MAMTVSSLSIALQGIADFIDDQFGEDVMVTLDSPLRAQERARGAGDKHVLNLFFYRIAPSGFHAHAGADDRFFIRVNALVTAFPNEQNDDDGDADLRVLGHAIRVLASRPVIPAVLPGAAGADPDDFRNGDVAHYRLQAVLQAPSMEELNHIWTTQGGDLAYRLSAAYEFALVPIEPLELAQPAGPMRTGIVDVAPSVKTTDLHVTRFGAEAQTFPLAGPQAGDPSPVAWLPVQMLVDGERLTSALTIAPAAATVRLALAGPPAARTALRVSWARKDGGADVQADQVFDIQTANLDAPEGRIDLNLAAPADGDTAFVDALPLDAADNPIAGAPSANRLSLTVEAAP